MRLLVCGGRTYGYMLDKQGYKRPDPKVLRYIHDCLSPYAKLDDPLTLIQGGAKGADEFAKKWALANNIEVEEYKANWDKYGRSAGFKRNAEMLSKGKPDLVMAFPGGPGTSMMIKLAKSKQVDVIEL